MDLPQDIKHLFLSWLEDEAIKATMQGTKVAMLYNRALDSLRKFKDPIMSPKDLKQVRLIGDKIVEKMSVKLKQYCLEEGYVVPESVKTPTKLSSSRVAKRVYDGNVDDEDDDVDHEKKKSKRKTKKYVPAKRSGGYAILIVLYEFDRERKGMRKEEIIRKAGPYCDKSFSANHSTSQFYSAWNSSKTLMKNDLIKCFGRPLNYYLTDEGLELVKGLRRAEGLQIYSPLVGKNKLFANTFASDRSIKSTTRSVAFSDEESDSSDHSLLNLIRSTRTSKQIPLEHEREPPKDYITLKEKEPEVVIAHSDSFQLDSRCNKQNQHIVWPEGSFEIIMIIDNREVRSQQERDFFSNQLTDMHIKVEMRALSVGDGVWIARNKQGQEVVLDFILERKRLDDLASSIKDGRFAEQKSRLRRTGMKYVYYVVEEEMSNDVSKMGEAIQTAISMTMTSSRFLVKKTRNADDTVTFFARLTKQVKKYYENKSLVVIESNNIESQLDYGRILDKTREETKSEDCVYPYEVFHSIMSKTDMATVREMYIKILMTIKGVSLQKAIVIQKKFRTPKELISSYEMITDEKEKKTFLAKAFKDEIGSRKIGPVLSEKLYEVWGKFEP